METICSNCGSKNKSTNIKCEHCGNNLNEVEEIIDISTEDYTEKEPRKLTEEQKEANQKSLKIFLIIFIIMFTLPFIIIGVVFTSISSMFTKIDNEISSGYHEIQGALAGYTDTQANGTYKGVYEYEVDGKIYTVTTNYASSLDIFEDYVTVKYNPENPENAIVQTEASGLEMFNYIGISILAIVSIVMVITIIIIIKTSSKNTKSDPIKRV